MDVNSIEKLLNSNRDVLTQTDDLNELLEVVKRNLDYPYILKQNLYPFSSLSKLFD